MGKTKKEAFALEIRKKITDLANTTIDLEELSQIYSHREYQSGGANEMVDGDLTGIDKPFTAAQLANIITAINNLTKFMDMNSPTNNKYREWINTIRLVP